MADMLSIGDGPEPGSRPRRPAWRIAVAAALLALVAVRLLAHAVPAARGPAAAPAAPSAAAPAAPSAPGVAAGLFPPTEPVPDSLRLPVAGQRPAWLWPSTGRIDALRGLPRDRAGYAFTWVLGGWAVQADPTVPVGCGGDCYGPPRPVYYLADGAGSVLGLGSATRVAPAATAGALWLTSYPRGGYVGTAAGTAREVTGTGIQVGPAVRLPAGLVIARGTARGLLLAPAVLAGPTARYELWNPGSGRAERSFRAVLAASGTQVATTACAGRPGRCQVRLVDLATGRAGRIWLPAGGTAVCAGFSPDGRFLALLVGLGIRSGAGAAVADRLEVVGVADRRVRVVPPASLWSGALIGFGWSADGDALVTELGIGSQVRLMVWSPGRAKVGQAILAAAWSLALG